jgi:ABC-type nitrate/sulfonate/bicarbonate transport system substrate-binding protein
MIADHPDVVAAFVQATARGFAYAIQNPADAAQTLIDAVPEIDPDLVRASRLARPALPGRCAAWGQQSMEVWQGFSDFLVTNKILEKALTPRRRSPMTSCPAR